ncbi:MAG: hypothetical protein K2M06_05280 [Muribaculaceae bacterium]|nr:hypothetical protein [Muribaculaceae bacterium]
MKKALLSMAVAFCTAAAFAAPVTLDVKDATDIKGTDIPEVPAGTEGSTNGAARHIELESFVIDGYTFTVTQPEDEKAAKASYYYPMSTNPNGAVTVRMYTGSALTITAPAGVKMAKIEFSGSNGKTTASSYTCTPGELSDLKASAQTWTYAAGTESVTINYGAQFRISKMVVTPVGEGVEDPEPVEKTAFVLADEIAAGDEILFVAGGKVLGGLNNILAKGYGYLEVVDLPSDATDNKFSIADPQPLKVAAADGGYTFELSNGKLLGAKSNYNTFDTTADSDAARVWTVSFEDDGAATITNVATGNVVYQDPKYGSFGAYKADSVNDTLVKPFIYKKDASSGIQEVEVENAPVEYFNLQGIRVAEPARGLYIMRQGNKASKVYIR